MNAEDPLKGYKGRARARLQPENNEMHAAFGVLERFRKAIHAQAVIPFLDQHWPSRRQDQVLSFGNFALFAG